MPYRRRYKKKGTGRRYRKKWSRRGRKGKGQLGVVYAKLRQQASLNTNGAGVYTGDFAVRNPSGSSTWNNYTALYSEYRVCAYKVNFIPHVPAGNSTTVDYRPIFTAFDTDETSLTFANDSQAMAYDNCKYYALFRPWKRYLKVPKITTDGIPNGWQDVDAPVNHGRFAMYAANLDLSAFYGDFYVTYYVKFRGKR